VKSTLGKNTRGKHEMSSNISPFGKAGAVDVAFEKLQIVASENNRGCGF